MPDFHIGVERMPADGGTVLVHWHVTGTFTGAPFPGIHAMTVAVNGMTRARKRLRR